MPACAVRICNEDGEKFEAYAVGHDAPDPVMTMLKQLSERVAKLEAENAALSSHRVEIVVIRYAVVVTLFDVRGAMVFQILGIERKRQLMMRAPLVYYEIGRASCRERV